MVTVNWWKIIKSIAKIINLHFVEMYECTLCYFGTRICVFGMYTFKAFHLQTRMENKENNTTEQTQKIRANEMVKEKLTTRENHFQRRKQTNRKRFMGFYQKHFSLNIKYTLYWRIQSNLKWYLNDLCDLYFSFLHKYKFEKSLCIWKLYDSHNISIDF